MELSRDLLGENMYGTEWFHNTALYGQYFTLPRNSWTGGSSIVDIGDDPRSNWYGPPTCCAGWPPSTRMVMRNGWRARSTPPRSMLPLPVG